VARLRRENRNYERVIEWVFQRNHEPGTTAVYFTREELEQAHEELGIPRLRNLGDVIYTSRFRRELPESIRSTAPDGRSWIIRLAGGSQYRFVAVPQPWFEPTKGRSVHKIPDSTPGLILSNALTDEQALLAIVRYNRLIDVFLKITCYSLQNHLRTQVAELGQIEIDELYLGVDRNGAQYVIPVQAKGGRDKMGVVQIEQDLIFCRARFPNLICRAVGVQFMPDRVVAMMLFREQDGQITLEDERHLKLVPTGQISDAEVLAYNLSFNA
jgi:hypothetical protein